MKSRCLPDEPLEPTGVSVKYNAVVRIVGAYHDNQVTVTGPAGSDKSFTVSSSNPSVATASVDRYFSHVETHEVGEAVITVVTVNGLKTTYKVTVKEGIKDIPNSKWALSRIKAWLEDQGANYPEDSSKAELLEMISSE